MKNTTKLGFQLTWFNKVGDDLMQGLVEIDTTEDEIRTAFGLAKDEYPGDCEVKPEHLEWLKSKTNQEINLDIFDYFVEIYAR